MAHPEPWNVLSAQLNLLLEPWQNVTETTLSFATSQITWGVASTCIGRWKNCMITIGAAVWIFSTSTHIYFLMDRYLTHGLEMTVDFSRDWNNEIASIGTSAYQLICRVRE